jgi:hypothetical protein
MTVTLGSGTNTHTQTVYYGLFHVQVQTAIIHIPSSNKHMRETDFYHQHHDYDRLCRYAFPLSCWLWSSNPTQTQMPASLLIANFKKLHYHPHHPITPGECGTGLWLHSPWTHHRCLTLVGWWRFSADPHQLVPSQRFPSFLTYDFCWSSWVRECTRSLLSTSMLPANIAYNFSF